MIAGHREDIAYPCDVIFELVGVRHGGRSEWMGDLETRLFESKCVGQAGATSW